MEESIVFKIVAATNLASPSNKTKNSPNCNNIWLGWHFAPNLFLDSFSSHNRIAIRRANTTRHYKENRRYWQIRIQTSQSFEEEWASADHNQCRWGLGWIECREIHAKDSRHVTIEPRHRDHISTNKIREAISSPIPRVENKSFPWNNKETGNVSCHKYNSIGWQCLWDWSCSSALPWIPRCLH